METENRLASLNESAPLRCQARLGAPQSCSPAGPWALRPHRGGIAPTPGKRRLSRGRPPGSSGPGSGSLAAPSASPGRAGRLPLAGLRARAVPGLSPLWAGRPPASSSTSSVSGRRPPPVPLRTAVPGPTAAQPHGCAKKAAGPRSAAGRSLGERASL